MVKFAKLLIQPGEMIGVVTATSVGEPATQMTLKTFHQAGLGGQITQGVPRLKEIIDANKNIKSPLITCQILKPVEQYRIVQQIYNGDFNHLSPEK